MLKKSVSKILLITPVRVMLCVRQRHDCIDCILLGPNYFYNLCMQNAAADYNGDNQHN